MTHRHLYCNSVGWAVTGTPIKCALHISEVTAFAFKAEILLSKQSQHSKLGLIRKPSVTSHGQIKEEPGLASALLGLLAGCRNSSPLALGLRRLCFSELNCSILESTPWCFSCLFPEERGIMLERLLLGMLWETVTQCPNHSRLILRSPHRLTSPLTDCPPPDQRLCRQEGAEKLISQSKSFSFSLEKSQASFPSRVTPEIDYLAVSRPAPSP